MSRSLKSLSTVSKTKQLLIQTVWMGIPRACRECLQSGAFAFRRDDQETWRPFSIAQCPSARIFSKKALLAFRPIVPSNLASSASRAKIFSLVCWRVFFQHLDAMARASQIFVIQSGHDQSSELNIM
jgi:hypothetical protein